MEGKKRDFNPLLIPNDDLWPLATLLLRQPLVVSSWLQFRGKFKGAVIKGQSLLRLLDTALAQSKVLAANSIVAALGNEDIPYGPEMLAKVKKPTGAAAAHNAPLITGESKKAKVPVLVMHPY